MSVSCIRKPRDAKALKKDYNVMFSHVQEALKLQMKPYDIPLQCELQVITKVDVTTGFANLTQDYLSDNLPEKGKEFCDGYAPGAVFFGAPSMDTEDEGILSSIMAYIMPLTLDMQVLTKVLEEKAQEQLPKYLSGWVPHHARLEGVALEIDGELTEALDLPLSIVVQLSFIDGGARIARVLDDQVRTQLDKYRQSIQEQSYGIFSVRDDIKIRHTDAHSGSHAASEVTYKLPVMMNNALLDEVAFTFIEKMIDELGTMEQFMVKAGMKLVATPVSIEIKGCHEESRKRKKDEDA